MNPIMIRFFRLFVPIIIALLSLGVLAQEDEGNPVTWSLATKAGKQALRSGAKFDAVLSASMAPGWHVYSLTQGPGGPVTTMISVPKSQPFVLAGTIRAPKPEKAFDPNFQIDTEFYQESAEFTLPIAVASGAKAGMQDLQVEVYFQACNETSCLPPTTVKLTAKVLLAAGAADRKPVAAVASVLPVSTSEPPHVAPATTPPAVSPQTTSPESSKPLVATAAASITTPAAPPGDGSFAGFLWLAAAMGAISLLTPCVFPMIPITVSYFTNHAGGSRRSAVFTALIYAIGIILTFTALGLALAALFGAGGVNQLATNPWVNLLITAIFLAFAFSLFGAYFLQVPPGLMNRIDSLTRSKEGSQVVGALLMGFTFTLTSFTCTAPFVGTLLVMTAHGNWRWPLAGMLAYSTVFAIPFFILALGPQLLSRLPRAGGWMNSIKVVMGFLEIAAAMKFLSNADLVWGWGIFTRQVVLAMWVAIGVLMVLYILGYFRMPHESPVESVGAARVTFAMLFLALTIWLVPGLFGRQLGELESFLPPEVSSSPGATGTASAARPRAEVDWILNDYEGALARAKQENKPLFVDFTGYTCTNCRWMEANMFPQPEVSRELERFVRVRLYTDGTGEIFERQQKLQQERFGTVALPYYAILQHDGSAVATFPGLTRDANEFLAFLRQERKQRHDEQSSNKQPARSPTTRP